MLIIIFGIIILYQCRVALRRTCKNSNLFQLILFCPENYSNQKSNTRKISSCFCNLIHNYKKQRRIMQIDFFCPLSKNRLYLSNNFLLFKTKQFKQNQARHKFIAAIYRNSFLKTNLRIDLLNKWCKIDEKHK